MACPRRTHLSRRLTARHGRAAFTDRPLHGGVRSSTRMTAVPSLKVNRSSPPGSGDLPVSVVHQPLSPTTEDTAAKTVSTWALMVMLAC